jgi:hypothetical protein
LRYFFILHRNIIARHIRDFGLNPLLGLLLIAVVFVGITFYLFAKTDYAPYIVAIAGLYVVAKLGKKDRNDFLKILFSLKHYRLTRLLENCALSLPFVAILCVKLEFLVAAILWILALLLSLRSEGKSVSFVVPTPFSRRPFEFAVGFRKTVVGYALVIFLLYQALAVDNVFLGLIALLISFVIMMSYYSEPEGEYFVWIFAATPKQFLKRKLRLALVQSSLLTLPIAAFVIGFFTDKFLYVLLLQVLGYLYLMTLVCAKYAAFPQQMSIAQGVRVAMGVWFPPLLLVIIPHFYKQAITNLKSILQ